MRYLRQFTFLMLAFICITSIIVSALLFSDTSGNSFGLPFGSLDTTPFSSYAIPAILLLAVLGLGSLVTFLFVYRSVPRYDKIIQAFAGVVIAFVLLQWMLLSTFSTLQTVYLLLALVLLGMGILIKNQLKARHAPLHHEASHSRPKHASANHSRKHKRR